MSHRHFSYLPRFSEQRHCPYCGCFMTKVRRRGHPAGSAPSFDHIMPIEWGGASVQDNFRRTCRRCNGLRAAAGHCVGALACVFMVAKSQRLDPVYILNLWRLPKPMPSWLAGPGFGAG